MNSFELNKILGAVLGTCLFLLAVHIASGAIFIPTPPAKPGYEIAVKEEQPAQGAAAKPAEVPIETMLAKASVQQGTADAKVCLTCHNFEKGQGNKIGPDLYGVVGRPVASVSGFSYSAALKAKGGTWTFDALNTWLTNPRADVPGTAMTFAGLPSEKQRADVIDYLNSNSDKPLPLPAAAQAPAPAGNTASNPPATQAAAPAATTAPPANAPALPQTNAPAAGQSSSSPSAAPASPPTAQSSAAPAAEPSSNPPPAPPAENGSTSPPAKQTSPATPAAPGSSPAPADEGSKPAQQ